MESFAEKFLCVFLVATCLLGQGQADFRMKHMDSGLFLEKDGIGDMVKLVARDVGNTKQDWYISYDSSACTSGYFIKNRHGGFLSWDHAEWWCVPSVPGSCGSTGNWRDAKVQDSTFWADKCESKWTIIDTVKVKSMYGSGNDYVLSKYYDTSVSKEIAGTEIPVTGDSNQKWKCDFS